MSPRTVIMDVFVRLVYPLMLVAAVWILLRGHNEPGGGFIGGMVAVAATAMLAAARGSALAQRRIPLGPLQLAAASVLLSLASGLPALIVGQSYMTHLWTTLPLGFTELKVSTVLAFDIGVFGAVWGALGGLCAQMIAIDEEPGPSADSTPAGAPGRLQ
jgi:multicomponent Na+:H+ antiporter subunit B